MNKKTELENWHKKWFTECRCELRESATQPVPGHGNPEAEIVFIGEAPGQKEDAQGVPFVGAAGKFLEELLTSVNLSRSDVYITNIVKYRPPNNRDPSLEEKDACREWLEGELAIISPKLIVFLGRHAMNNFFPGEQISKVHGKLLVKDFLNISTKYFFALYHPAAALYNGSMRGTLAEDFKKLPKVLAEITARKEPAKPLAQSKLFS